MDRKQTKDISNFGKAGIVKAVLTLIYVIGVGFTVYYGIKFCMHSTYVANPDAMLPFMEYERAFVMMALGCPFMAASTVSVIWAYGLRKTEHAVMLVKGTMEAAGLLTLLL